MAKRINYAKDGAEPAHWSSYLPLSVPAAFVILVVLRLVGAVSWSWWLILIPLWAMIVVYVASYLVARSEFRRQQGA